MTELAPLAQSAAAVATLIGVVGTLLFSWHNSRKVDAAKVKAAAALAAAEDAKAQLVLIDGEVRRVGKSIDGRVSDLITALQATADADIKLALAEGYAKGEQAQRDRAAPAENGGA